MTLNKKRSHFLSSLQSTPFLKKRYLLCNVCVSRGRKRKGICQRAWWNRDTYWWEQASLHRFLSFILWMTAILIIIWNGFEQNLQDITRYLKGKKSDVSNCLCNNSSTASLLPLIGTPSYFLGSCVNQLPWGRQTPGWVRGPLSLSLLSLQVNRPWLNTSISRKGERAG